ncbi:hypothetical protein LJR078_000417 [Arthrobacter sp. LjRoot78]|uniref:hypothetical protein n=1 Tax=Arthrobacter sp. LjRoot78 TaxID=3342338 RepID=UPI003ECD631A
MKSKAAVKTMEAVEASVSALAVLVRRGTGNFGSTSADPLRDRADACLDGLAEVARAEARLAALKVHFAAGYADAAIALAPPAVSSQAHTAQDMAATAEVACVLTVSERTAGALLAEARTLTNTLPLTMSAVAVGPNAAAPRYMHRAAATTMLAPVALANVCRSAAAPEPAKAAVAAPADQSAANQSVPNKPAEQPSADTAPASGNKPGGLTGWTILLILGVAVLAAGAIFGVLRQRNGAR